MAERFLWFACLLSFWCLLSGKWDAFHFGSGVLSCLAVAWISAKAHSSLGTTGLKVLPGRIFRFLLYLIWLTQRILMAAWHIACVVLDPKLPLNPKLSRHKSILSGDKNLTIFGTSITLTPGTITVDIQNGEVLVHELDSDSAGDITSYAMENEIAKIKGEEPS